MTKKPDKFLDILAPLSMNDKIELFDILLVEITGRGVNGDTKLAHINDYEDKLLRSVGGAGSINPQTGLRQYFGGGSKATIPTNQTVTQQATIPPEIAPYITDILGRAQAIQEKREAEGFVPYTGQQIAEFTPEQEKAFQGIAGLVGTGQQYFAPAAALTASSAMAPTAESVGQFMSPYMQNVVDVQQREARRAADVQQQQLAAGAVGAGGFGGSRQAILEAEQQRNLQQQLGDIQAKGLASAYEDAQQRLAQQRARELSAGSQFAGLGQVAPSVGLQELGALQQVGGVRQAQTQTALDLARQQFEAERTYPEQLLQRYSSIIRGYQMDPNIMRSSQTFAPAPSYLQQFVGAGVGAGSLGKAFGFFKEGGRLRPNAKGLSSIVIRRKKGGKVVRYQEGTGDDTVGGGNVSTTGFDPAMKSVADLQKKVVEVLDNLKGGGAGASAGDLRAIGMKDIEARKALAAQQEALAKRIAEFAPAEQRNLEYYQQERAMIPERRREVMAETEAQKEALNRAKFFELANIGFRFAEPQGGSGGVLSDLVRSFQPSVTEFGKISAAEAGLARQQRKELQDLSDRERDILAKEAGIDRNRLDRELKAESERLKAKETTIGLEFDLTKSLASLAAEQRKGDIEVAKTYVQAANVVSDYVSAMAKNLKVPNLSNPIKTGFENSIKDIHGYIIDTNSGQVKINGRTVTSNDTTNLRIAQWTALASAVALQAAAERKDPVVEGQKWIAANVRPDIDPFTMKPIVKQLKPEDEKGKGILGRIEAFPSATQTVTPTTPNSDPLGMRP